MEPLSLSQPLFFIGQTAISLGMVLAVVGMVLLVLVVSLWRMAQASKRAQDHLETVVLDREAMQKRMETLLTTQNEITGRMQTMAEVFSERHNTLNKTLSDRLDGMGQRLSNSVNESSKNTHETLRTLQERLATIDAAQKNITELSQGVVELQSILANKQTRGSFGQGRMEAIIKDGLPMGGYAFQHKLSNGKMPDCVIFLPNDAPSLVVDAKFPLEAWNALRESATPEAEKQASSRLRTDIGKHISDIRERYFLPGETHDTAFMFVPSESIFADLHERFEDMVQKAARARVVIVSPSLLMLSIQVVQAVLRDARLREQAHLIQDEVAKLMDDVGRLDDRVAKLGTHFGQAQRDIEQIQTSTRKIMSRGEKIGALDVAEHKTDAVEDKSDKAGSVHMLNRA
jgi:DNA recombination protein RmuC